MPQFHKQAFSQCWVAVGGNQRALAVGIGPRPVKIDQRAILVEQDCLDFVSQFECHDVFRFDTSSASRLHVRQQPQDDLEHEGHILAPCPI
jgi:hypothetical protein